MTILQRYAEGGQIIIPSGPIDHQVGKYICMRRDIVCVQTEKKTIKGVTN